MADPTHAAHRFLIRSTARVVPATPSLIEGLEGADRASLLQLIRQRATDPTIFDEVEPFIWMVEASNNSVDFYDTRMHESTLDNFAAGITAGVQFLHSHDTREYIGWSLRGWHAVESALTHDDGLPVRRVVGAFYTIPGRRFGSMTTDDFIAGVRSGVFNDVSVGFWSDDVRCSICGKQMYMGWFGVYPRECNHVPGKTYARTDGEGNELVGPDGNPITVKAYAWVYNGELGEVSGPVYDGATEGAGFLKVNLMAAAGAITDAERVQYEAVYRAKLPAPGQPAGIVAAESRSTERAGAPMGDKPTATVNVTLDDLRDSILDFARGIEIEVPAAADSAAILRTVGEEVARLRARAAELEAEAAIGRAYHAELVDDAIKAGVRAKGAESFKEATYRAILERAGIEEIKALRDDWTAEGDTRLAGSTGQPGGRLTREGADPITAGTGAPATPKIDTPAAAYS